MKVILLNITSNKDILMSDWEEKFLNQIIQGNCLELLTEIPSNIVDLIVTSPPYNCGINYDSYNDNKTWKDYIEWCKNWLVELKRVLKKDGRICINVPLDLGLNGNNKIENRVSPYAEFYSLFKEVNIKSCGCAVWTDNQRVKNTAWGSWKSSSCPYIYNPYEVIMFGYKSQWKKENKGISTISKDEFIKGVSGVWNLRPQTKQITKANFSTDLSDICIKLLSYKDDIILDPFIGSGTTAISAKILHRKYIGIELSKNYTKIAKNRVNNTVPLLEEFLIEEDNKRDIIDQKTFFDLE
jgi:site-specific DNA-methyltransferase (adenine-specific)